MRYSASPEAFPFRFDPNTLEVRVTVEGSPIFLEQENDSKTTHHFR